MKAAVLDAKGAERAWRAWEAPGGDLDHLAPREFALLPLVARNLSRHGIESASSGRLQGIARRTWYRNRLLVPHAAEAITTLSDAGMRTMLLKGAALLAHYAPDFGAWEMNDIDILIPAARARDGLDALRSAGWAIGPPHDRRSVPGLIRFEHGVSLHHRSGANVDLHWYALAENLRPGIDDALWASAVPATLHGVGTLVPSPEQMVLHTVANGQRGGRAQSLRWPADVAAVLATSPTLSWRTVANGAIQRRLGRRIGDGLEMLAGDFELPIPQRVISHLRRGRPVLSERLGARAARSRTFRGRRRNLLLKRYLEVSAAWPAHRRLLGWPGFLAYAWELERTSALPRELWRRTTNQHRVLPGERVPLARPAPPGR